MTDQNNVWPHLGSVLKGAAAVILAMAGFSTAVLIPYLHVAKSQADLKPTMVHSAVPSAAAEEGGGTIRLNDFASAAAAQAAKDNAGRLRKAGLAQDLHLSQPEAWALAEKIYENAAAELARGRNEAALRGFQQAADYYQKTIRLSASN